jgi:hypothetical protein
MTAWRQSVVQRVIAVVRFVANTVVVDDSDDEFILVGFADEQGGEYREGLHFQRAHEFDEQDIALGHDRVYAERNGQGQGGYGGVERVELHRSRVRVVICGELAEQMGTPEFDIALSLPPAEFEQLRDGLRVVFAGFGSLVEYPAEPGSGSGRGGM